ncbi:MAG: hypothetical protein KDA41_15460, partial [Planctomycetales bacterium]|nr:hypothetical protein [Planctomycetales bacterium]
MAVGAAHAAEADRSPVDLALGPGDAWLVTANQTSDSLSLVRTADGVVLHEVAAGQHPTAVVVAPDGNTVLASARDSGEVRLFQVVDGQRLLPLRTIDVGFQPHGVAVTADGKTAYVALAAAAQVARCDLETGVVVERIATGKWPRYLALSPDGARLAVG